MPKIKGVGMSVPQNIVTNEELEHLNTGVDAKWTASYLNVKERRICNKETVLDLAEKASIEALKDAHSDHSTIDLIVVGTTTPYKQAPSTACHLQERLHLIGPPAFDMTAVCASFMYALVATCDMMATNKYRNALIVGADAMSKYTDWNDRSCVFFGDGAGAVVLSNEPSVLATHWGSDGKGAKAWTIEDGHWRMDGKWVYQLAVDYLCISATECLKRANLKAKDIDLVIPHQPGIKILIAAAKSLQIPFEKVYTIMDKYANTSSACIPMGLKEALDAKRIKKGDRILLTGVGAGWTCASVILEW